MITFHYGTDVFVLPTACAAAIARAGDAELRVLLLLGAEPALRDEEGIDTLAARLQLTRAQTDAAIAYWRGTGVLEVESAQTNKTKSSKKKAQKEAQPDAEPKPEEKKRLKQAPTGAVILPRAVSLPEYSSSELATIIESRKEAAGLLDECSRAMGKVLTYHDDTIILGMLDFLNCEAAYILDLITYCYRHGKTNLHQVEKLALALMDDGITTAAALQERLKSMEAMEDICGKVRRMFGIGTRQLTTKEQKFIDAWVNIFHYDEDVIFRAYEITANAVGSASIPYANAILERWNSENLRTISEIDHYIEESKKGISAAPPAGSSFETNDFFDAALRRTFDKEYPLPALNEKKKK